MPRTQVESWKGSSATERQVLRYVNQPLSVNPYAINSTGTDSKIFTFFAIAESFGN